MNLPTLYKYTELEQVQEWTIYVEGDSFYTIEGINTLSESKPTVCQGKNIGKSNETTPEQQAELEARAKWQKKKDKGYNEILTNEEKFFEPMLAHERSKYEKLLFTVPTYVSRKYDGVRIILDGNGTLTSRNGKPVVSCPHLSIRGFLLDGEAYNHLYKEDFNKIISLVRKTKPNQEDLEESAEKIEYHIYDYPEVNAKFSTRYEFLKNAFETCSFPSYFKLVKAYQVHSLEEIEKYHEQFLSEGYEGTMIRLDLGNYENKRSKQLLKYKNFQDAEFLILDVEEGLGNRSGMAGKLLCKIGNNSFGCSMTGTQEFMTQVLKDKDKVIGLEATVKFFQLTPDGIPRFPTLKNIIGYENGL